MIEVVHSLAAIMMGHPQMVCARGNRDGVLKREQLVLS